MVDICSENKKRTILGEHLSRGFRMLGLPFDNEQFCKGVSLVCKANISTCIED